MTSDGSAGSRETRRAVTIGVTAPRVRGGRVDFSWVQDHPNELQRRNHWWVHYHGVPVHRMHRRLLMEVLLSLQLPLWAAQGDRVRVHLEEPVGRVSLEFWRAYYDAEHVTFHGAVDDCRSYDPGRRGARRRLGRPVPPKDVAVSFGGGKDSTLAHAALLERRPSRAVLLLHVLHPFHHSPSVRRRVTARSLLTIVWPARRLSGSPVQVVSTDFMAQLRDVPGPRPHINLYAAAMLPALVHHDVHQVTYSRTALGFRVVHRPDGSLAFANPGGRPERLRHLRRYLGDVVGLPLHAESTHYAIGEYVSFATVLQEYPRRFASMVMCTQNRGRGRFCHQCRKCLEFALLGLALGHVAGDLDYDVVLSHPRVRKIVDVAHRQRRRAGEHPRYHPRLGTASHFATWCHALHRIDPERPDLPVGDRARDVLRTLVRTWGHPFPAVERLDARAVAHAGPLGREVAGVAARHFPVVDPTRVPAEEAMLLVGNRPAQFDHDAVLPTPLLDEWAERWQVPDVDDAGGVGRVT